MEQSDWRPPGEKSADETKQKGGEAKGRWKERPAAGVRVKDSVKGRERGTDGSGRLRGTTRHSAESNREGSGFKGSGSAK